jgi:5-deoxy-glucuronate isomerase
MTLLRRGRPPTDTADGLIVATDPLDAGWRWLSFAAFRLADGQSTNRPGDGQEVVLVVAEGTARIRVDGRDLGALGSRASVFDGAAPPLVLVAPGSRVECTSVGRSLVAVVSADGGATHRTVIRDPREIATEIRGAGITERQVRQLLPASAEAGRLIVSETFAPGGHWSSWPPHKHDTDDPPRETQLEETYFYRFARPEGMALQRIYTADRTLDETVIPHDTDLVLVPRGYHPVASAPGYDTWYLNAMAGPRREWRISIDPEHDWQS